MNCPEKIKILTITKSSFCHLQRRIHNFTDVHYSIQVPFTIVITKKNNSANAEINKHAYQ